MQPPGGRRGGMRGCNCLRLPPASPVTLDGRGVHSQPRPNLDRADEDRPSPDGPAGLRGLPGPDMTGAPVGCQSPGDSGLVDRDCVLKAAGRAAASAGAWTCLCHAGPVLGQRSGDVPPVIQLNDDLPEARFPVESPGAGHDAARAGLPRRMSGLGPSSGPSCNSGSYWNRVVSGCTVAWSVALTVPEQGLEKPRPGVKLP